MKDLKWYKEVVYHVIGGAMEVHKFMGKRVVRTNLSRGFKLGIRATWCL